MRFPFKHFWHVIPYSFMFLYFLHSGVSSVQHYTLLMLCFALSTLKTDSFSRVVSSVFRWGLMVLEGIMLYWLVTASLLTPFHVIGIPILDYFWLSNVKDRRWLIEGLSVAGITLFGALFGQSIMLLPVPMFAMWLGLALRDLEQKRHEAYVYYDQLRVSEEALKKASKELEAYYETVEELAKLRERTRISRDIHDHVGHTLSTTLIQLQMIEMRLEKAGSEDKTAVSRLTLFIRDALEDTRSIVHDMSRSGKLERHLKHDVQELCQRFSVLSGVSVALTISEALSPVLEEVADTLFRAIQESLTNALKHGDASEIKVVLAEDESKLQLTIKDNGHVAPDYKEGFGLKQMRNRVNELHGLVYFSTEESQGFMTKIILPKEV